MASRLAIDRGVAMRTTLLLLCLALEAVPWVSAQAGSVETPQPDDAALLVGIRQAISDSHFAPPIEVTDLFKAPSSSSNSWMVCIRSGQSNEARRITYSAFFNEQYIQSRYSVFYDNCGTQQYHLFVDPATIPPPPKPAPVQKKRHRSQAK
jgi:hypothetical protein